MDEMDFDNKLLFIVDLDAHKPEIRDAIQDQYDVTVTNVNTQITPQGEKKATVTLSGGRRRTGRRLPHRGVLKMGRRIQGQRRGRGTSTFRAPSHRYKAELSHRKAEDTDVLVGEVVDIEHDPRAARPSRTSSSRTTTSDSSSPARAPQSATRSRSASRRASRRATPSRSRRFPRACPSATSRATPATVASSLARAGQRRPHHARA